MSGTAETEMQIQIVIHGEAFCPSMMTTETPFANRKLLLEEITNNERNGIEEEQMEEIEIKEGHDDVEEEQGNKAKENPFVNQKLLLEEITNNERNDMEEGQMEENEIKEGHEDVEEEQDNEIKLPINNNVTRSAWSASETTIILHPVQHYDKAVKMLKVKAMQEELRQLWFAVFAQFAQKEINKMQLEEQKNPWQKENEDSHFDLELDPLNRKLWLEEIINNERKAMEVRQMEKNEIKEGHEDVGEKQNNKAEETPIANRKLLLQKITNNKRNEMEEEPLEEIEIKEGHEDVEEEQDNMKMKLFRIMVIVNNIKERQEEVQEEQDEEVTWEHLELSFLSLEASLKGFEGGPGYSILKKCLTNRWNPFDEKMKISRFLERKTKLDEILENWLKTGGKFTDAVDFLRHYQPLPPKEAMSKKKRNMKHHGMLPMSGQTGRYVVQGGAQKERGKLIENPELSGKFDDAEKDIQELEQLLRCKVCLDSDACIVFLPCRHMATCEYCEGFLHHCPVCRSFIEEAVKINEE